MLKTKRAGVVTILVVATCLRGMAVASTRETQVLSPKQSAAMAKQFIKIGIDALGGSAYLNVRDVTCRGQFAEFNHAGELIGINEFVEYAEPPLKDRQESLSRHTNVQVFNGENGWYLDSDGVSVAPKEDVERFKEEAQTDIGHILRQRINEPDMVFRYAGSDVVDLQPVDWVELVGDDNRTMRIAFAKNTHLPIRKSIGYVDPDIQPKSEEVEYYSNYRVIDGIAAPFHITRDRNGIRVFEMTYTTCSYNTNLSESLFSRESLGQHQPDAEKTTKKRK